MEIYNKLLNSSDETCDVILMQDSILMKEAFDGGSLIRYIPEALKADLDNNEMWPTLLQQYNIKIFAYNHLGDSVHRIRNVWELTAPEMKGKIHFKNPEYELSNMRFLITLTSDKWAGRLAKAYESWSGEQINLGSYQNAGYKWIDEFLKKNVTFGKSDISIAEEISQPSSVGDIGLFSVSKLRSSSVYTDNLTVAIYDDSIEEFEIEPFSGFMFPMYTAISVKSSRPYTSMLFIEYLMSKEGFNVFAKTLGAYSPVSEANTNRLSLQTMKNSLVIEGSEYIQQDQENNNAVAYYILQLCGR